MDGSWGLARNIFHCIFCCVISLLLIKTTAAQNELSGHQNELSGHQNELSGHQNELSGHARFKVKSELLLNLKFNLYIYRKFFSLG